MRSPRPREAHCDLEELVEYLWQHHIDIEGALEEVAARMLAADPDRRQRVQEARMEPTGKKAMASGTAVSFKAS